MSETIYILVCRGQGQCFDAFRVMDSTAYCSHEQASAAVPGFIERCKDPEGHLDALEPGTEKVHIQSLTLARKEVRHEV